MADPDSIMGGGGGGGGADPQAPTLGPPLLTISNSVHILLKTDWLGMFHLSCLFLALERMLTSVEQYLYQMSLQAVLTVFGFFWCRLSWKR